MTKPVAINAISPILGELLKGLNDNDKQHVRSIEKVQKKLINTRNAVFFNETCLEQGLLPEPMSSFTFKAHQVSEIFFKT